MDWNEGSAKLDHLRPADRSLQPSPMVKGSIPITKRRVIFPEGDLEVIIVVITNNGPFDLHIITRWPGREAKFSEVADFFRERRSQVEHELSEIETAHRSFFIRR